MEGFIFSKVLKFIEESILACVETTTPEFYLKELTEMYDRHLIAQGTTETANSVHRTRLKNAILENVPGLCVTKRGKYVLLTLNGELRRALFNACLSSCSDDGILLAKAAQIIRKYLLRHKQQFNGDMSKEREFEGIPSSIFQLISLLIEGGYTQDSTPECSEKIIGNLSQLVMLKSVKNKRKETVSRVCHSKLKELPLPVYLGMVIHNKTRKKGLVNKFAEQGLSISYSRLQKIHDNIAGQLCHQHVTEGVVRPKSLKDGLFIYAVVDNIGSNPFSTTANSAFHGTAVSIF